MRDMLNLKDYTGEELKKIIDLAIKMKKEPEKYVNLLKHKTLLMLFQKSSTRTRISFEVGMTQLGGHAIFFDWKQSQLKIGASIQDEAKCFERYVDIIAARLKYASDLALMAEAVDTPVIDMCSEKYHPCQGMADLMTVYEHAGEFEGVKIVYTGIANNVSNSLVVAGTKLGAQVTLAIPEKDSDAVDEELEADAKSTGNYEETPDVEKAVQDADFVYTDTWINMEFMNDPSFKKEKERRLKTFMPYQVNANLMAKASEGNAKFMHCLPAHKDYEVTREVLDSKNAVIFDQAENRLHVQKAIMAFLLDLA